MYRFSLKKGPQISCPSCGQRRYSPYIDNLTGIELAPDLCGKCSRLNNCGLHYPPRDLFVEYPEFIPKEGVEENVKERIISLEVTLMEVNDLTKTLERDEEIIFENTLIEYLSGFFSKDQIKKTIEDYLIGFDNEMIIFWQLDYDGRIRTGKKMLYNHNGRRDKKHLYLMHQELYDEDFVLQECFFGEHLVNQYPNKEIRIVESEKSAIICSMVWPEFIWISTGGKNKFLQESWYIFDMRSVTLIPDEDAMQEWEIWLEEMSMVGLNVDFDNFCKDKDPQSDIADFILNKLSDED